jgi:hypothetical protein
MLTLAAFVAEKFGGDTMDDVRANLEAYRARIARPIDAPVAGGRRTAAEPDAAAATAGVAHGLTGTDEAGSGGDD